MENRGFRLGTIYGTTINVDYSWLIIFFIVTWFFSMVYYPSLFPDQKNMINVLLGFITSLLFFASALTHEFLHSYVAKKNGIEVRRITLFLFGGISELFEEPTTPEVEFRVAISGPAASLTISLFFLLIWLIFDRYLHNPIISTVSSTLFQVNIMLSLFNLLPGFPLDGGRILRSLIWASKKDIVSATRIATTGGKAVSLFIIFFGIFQIVISGFWGGIWLVLIGLFLNQAAGQNLLELQIKQALEDKSVVEFMWLNPVIISPNLSINEAIAEYFLKYNAQSFLVVDNDNVIGLISLNDLRKQSRLLTEDSRVSHFMKIFPKNIFLSPNDNALKALKLMTKNEITFVPIKKDQKIVGVVTVDEIAKFLADQGII